MKDRSWNALTVLLGAAAMIAALAIFAVYGAVLHRIAINAHGATGDFLSFYGAGFLVRTGRAAHLYDPATLEWAQRRLYPGSFDEAIGYPLPVFVAWCFAPLSLLPFTLSFFVFMGAMTLLLAGLVLTFRRALVDVPPLPRNLFLAGAAFGMPSIASIVFGQVDLIALAGLTAGYLLLKDNRPRAAGIALALVLVKPHMLLGVGLLLLVRRDWRALGSLAAVGLPLLIVPALLSAPGALLDNMRIIASYPGAGKALSVNAAVMPNWRGFIVSLINNDSIWLWFPGFAAIAVAVAGAAVTRWRTAAFDQSYALAAMLPLLVSPHVHTQNLVLLLLPGAILLRSYCGEGSSHVRELRAANALLLAYTIAFALPIIAILGLSLGVFPLLVFFGALVTLWPHQAVVADTTKQTQVLARVA